MDVRFCISARRYAIDISDSDPMAKAAANAAPDHCAIDAHGLRPGPRPRPRPRLRNCIQQGKQRHTKKGHKKWKVGALLHGYMVSRAGLLSHEAIWLSLSRQEHTQKTPSIIQ